MCLFSSSCSASGAWVSKMMERDTTPPDDSLDPLPRQTEAVVEPEESSLRGKSLSTVVASLCAGQRQTLMPHTIGSPNPQSFYSRYVIKNPVVGPHYLRSPRGILSAFFFPSRVLSPSLPFLHTDAQRREADVQWARPSLPRTTWAGAAANQRRRRSSRPARRGAYSLTSFLVSVLIWCSIFLT
jgi:hypothetical protein